MSSRDFSPAGRGLPAALAAHARNRPEEPWLFYAEGLDWRWRSWRQLAGWVARWAAPLAALPAGTRVGFAGAASPPALALDLAIQSCGLIAVPLARSPAPSAPPAVEAWQRALAARRCDVWAERVAGMGTPGAGAGRSAAGVGPCPRLVDLPPEDGSSRQVGTVMASGGSALHAPLAGGVVVDSSAGPSERSQAELVAAAASIQDLVAAATGGADDTDDKTSREIVVAALPLADPAGRALLAWATVAGAAVVLEPDAARLVPTAAWARPTLFHGSAAELAALRRIVESQPGRRRGWAGVRPRLPFGRLRTALVVEGEGGGAMADSDLAFWESRGVRVAAAPVV
ncbi:MAG TPA: hypothetical protein VHR45_20940 [Thermoanaerobaculia bacterium]|nr:hypothetical protein [Thermoanaerobaculia bacterium]